MNIDTILNRLDEFGIPYECMQINTTPKMPAPEPPYITWAKEETGRGPDGISNLLLDVNMLIAIYTDTEDAALERRFEDTVLPDIGYQKRQEPIPDENLIETSYEFSFTQKRKRV